MGVYRQNASLRTYCPKGSIILACKYIIGWFYKLALSDFRFISESRVSVFDGFCPPGNGGTEGGEKTIDDAGIVTENRRQAERRDQAGLGYPKARRRKAKPEGGERGR